MIPKIIHLSDIHIGAKHSYERFVLLIEELKTKISNPERCVIIITGDLIDSTLNNPLNPYKYAVQYLDMLKTAGFKVLVCPGNHDYGVGFISFTPFRKLFKKAFFKDTAITYPKRDVIGDVAFFGLDSMECELHVYDNFSAEGELGAAQLQRLANMLAVETSKYKVVYLHHHPFDGERLLKLKDSAKLEATLKPFNIDMLLFGHKHGGEAWNGRWGIKRVYDGGTSTGKDHAPQTKRLIDLSQPVEDDHKF